MSAYESKKFKQLQELWYQKLKDDGFRDQESPGGYLRGTEKRTWDRAIDDRDKREAYFERATDVLHKYRFETELERQIWEMHSEGYSVRKISSEVKKPRATVQWIIKNLRLKVRLEGHWKKLRSEG